MSDNRCWVIIAMVCLALATPLHAAETDWPTGVEYHAVVGAWSGSSEPMAIGYSIETDGHSRLVASAREWLTTAGRTPEAIHLHCPGPSPIVAGGHHMGIENYYVHRESHPLAWSTLGLWRQLADECDADLWIYLGRARHPTVDRYHAMPAGELLGVISWTLSRVAEAGFDGVWLDNSSQLWQDVHDGGRNAQAFAFRHLKSEARRLGLRVGVEAWPHAWTEPDTAGLPVFLTRRSGADSWGTQHPLVTANNDWQASPTSHAGLVWVQKESGKPYELTTELAQRIVATGCVVGVNADQWPAVAPELPPRVRSLRVSESSEIED